MALNVVSSDRLSTNVKTSNLATGLSDKVGQSKNIIINGAMDIAQRAASSTAEGYVTVDRWTYGVNGNDEAVTTSQHDLTSSDTGPWAKGFRKSWHIQNGNQTGGAGAADYIELCQSIEAQNIANSGWDYTSSSSYITLSFWVKSSVAQNFYGYLRTVDGTGRQYRFETTSLTADTWKKVTVTVPGDSNITVDNNNATGLMIWIAPFYGTNYTDNGNALSTWVNYSSSTIGKDYTSTWWTTNDATFEITGVQLEVGDTATEFEHRSYADELARCQRYCVDFPINSQLGLGQVYSGSGYVQLPVALPVPMRTKPSVSKNGSYWFNSNYGNSGYSGDRAVTVETPATGSHMYRLFVAGGSDQGNATTVWCQLHDAAGTYMRLEAEL